MFSKKLMGSLALGGMGLSMFAGLQGVDAWTNYSIQTPATSANSKPNGKDLYNVEMVSYPDNDFAAKLIQSGEGKGTLTTMWMELQNSTTNTSNGVNVKQGGSVYYASHKGAGYTKSTWHNITVENNNFNAKSYAVSGSWSADNSY